MYKGSNCDGKSQLSETLTLTIKSTCSSLSQKKFLKVFLYANFTLHILGIFCLQSQTQISQETVLNDSDC